MTFSVALLFFKNELFSTVADAGDSDASQGDVPRTQQRFDERLSN
jgi:hypothetical protein